MELKSACVINDEFKVEEESVMVLVETVGTECEFV